jgi:hypothetical protein
MYRYNNQWKVLRGSISYLDYAPIVQNAATFFGKSSCVQVLVSQTGSKLRSAVE